MTSLGFSHCTALPLIWVAECLSASWKFQRITLENALYQWEARGVTWPSGMPDDKPISRVISHKRCTLAFMDC
jgi:hypothetical protein